MKVLVVYTHPNPKSFNHAILEEVQAGLAEAGHEVKVRDLYAEPIKSTLDGEDFGQILSGTTPPDIAREQELLTWAEGLVFLYPIWWFGLPAALKGWVDRVFLQGFAFKFEGGGVKGLLRNPKALVVNTTGGPRENYAQTDSLGIYIRPFTDGTLRFCGIPDVQDKTFFGVVTASQQERASMLKEARSLGKNF